jgi:hypothetical protein
MRSLLSLPIVTLLACAVAPKLPPRFLAGAPQVRTLDPDSPSIGPALAKAVASSALELAGCIDELSARRNLRSTVHVSVAMQLRSGALTVADVAPADPASISDRELVRCIADLASGWAVHGEDADVEMPLTVSPHALAGAAEAMARAAAAPTFQPEE